MPSVIFLDLKSAHHGTLEKSYFEILYRYTLFVESINGSSSGVKFYPFIIRDTSMRYRETQLTRS